jgi:D-alanyl-D-alanine dipeptidase
MRTAALLTVAFTVAAAEAGDFRPPASSSQAVVVLAPTWNSAEATLQRWSRHPDDSRWLKEGESFPVLVGERGLGWGLGLHGHPKEKGPSKVEGDRRAPAGIFRITGAFGASATGVGKMPWQRITPTLEAIDDPESRFYNRIVDRARIAGPDWQSSERMAKIPAYALGLVVAHNPKNIPGDGSCIFIHLDLGQRRGTAGCTALRERDLDTLVRWLDPKREPVLIQLPQAIAASQLDGF